MELNKKSLLSLVLTFIILFSVSFSLFYVSCSERHHSCCTDDNCPICEQFVQCEALLTSLSFTIFCRILPFIISLCLFVFKNKQIDVIRNSLISLKVRLNN